MLNGDVMINRYTPINTRDEVQGDVDALPESAFKPSPLSKGDERAVTAWLDCGGAIEAMWHNGDDAPETLLMIACKLGHEALVDALAAGLVELGLVAVLLQLLGHRLQRRHHGFLDIDVDFLAGRPREHHPQAGLPGNGSPFDRQLGGGLAPGAAGGGKMIAKSRALGVLSCS